MKKITEKYFQNKIFAATIITIITVCFFNPKIITLYEFSSSKTKVYADEPEFSIAFIKDRPLTYEEEYAKNVLNPITQRVLNELAINFNFYDSYKSTIPIIIYIFSIWCFSYLILNKSSFLVALASGLLFASINFIDLRTINNLPRILNFLPVILGLIFYTKKNLNHSLINTIIACLFYAPTAFICGLLATSIYLGQNIVNIKKLLSINKDSVKIVITALICLATMLSQVINSKEYGNLITPVDHAEYPEASNKGRYGGETADSYPFNFKYYGGWAFNHVLMNMVYNGETAFITPEFSRKIIPWITLANILIFIIAIISWIFLLIKSDPIINITTSLMVITTLFSHLFYPYLWMPNRFILMLLPLILIYCLCTGVNKILKLKTKNFQSEVLTLLFITTFIFMNAIDLREYNHKKPIKVEGFEPWYFFNVKNKKFYNFLEQNGCKESLYAGFMKFGSAVNFIPTITNCAVLINYESHQAIHSGFVLETRKKAMAVIDVFFDDTEKSLLKLKENFGVTHFIIEEKFKQDLLFNDVEEDDQTEKKNTFEYFQPFNSYIEEMRSKHKNTIAFIYKEDLSDYEIYKDEELKVIDLVKYFSVRK